MKSHVELITTPTSDTPGSAVLVHFDDQRYIFGQFHEGLQRALLERGIKLSKIRDLFITGRTEWANTGGIFGLILTLADGANSSAAARAEEENKKADRAKELEAEVRPQPKSKKTKASTSADGGQSAAVPIPTLRLHGGPNLVHTLATARSFIFRQGMPLNVEEFSETEGFLGEQRKPDFEDKHIKVWAMAIQPRTHDQDTAQPHPKSPRKRSLGDYIEGQRSTEDDEHFSKRVTTPAQDQDRSRSYEKIRHNVGGVMFNYYWRYDCLVETPLRDVKMPATIFVRDPETKKLSRYRDSAPGLDTLASDTMVLVRQAWPGALIDTLPPTRPSKVAMSYILQTHQRRGKFRPNEAKRVGVPTGPWKARERDTRRRTDSHS